MNIILFETLEIQSPLPRSDERAQHILKILHLGCGDSFVAGEINTSKGLATITGITDEQILFSYQREEGDSAPLYPVTLLVAQVRPICMRRILREAVSLGAGRIILCGADTAEKSYADANLYKSGGYRSILLDGAMQSGQCGVSEVVFARHIGEAIKKIGSDVHKIVLDNVLEATPLSSMEIPPASEVVLAIGPERGFSDRERSLFLDAGFVPASLGSRILRTETACSAGLGVLLGRMHLL